MLVNARLQATVVNDTAGYTTQSNPYTDRVGGAVSVNHQARCATQHNTTIKNNHHQYHHHHHVQKEQSSKAKGKGENRTAKRKKNRPRQRRPPVQPTHTSAKRKTKKGRRCCLRTPRPEHESSLHLSIDHRLSIHRSININPSIQQNREKSQINLPILPTNLFHSATIFPCPTFLRFFETKTTKANYGELSLIHI